MATPARRLVPEQKVQTAPLGTHVNPRSGEKVTVACKLPHGLILRVFNKTTRREAILGGGTREFEVFEPDPNIAIRIHGNVAPFGKAVPGLHEASGYALTHNVPKDIWDRWLEANADSDIVRQKLVFAAPTRDAAESMATDAKDVRSGLEPMNPERKQLPNGRSAPVDPRWPRSTRVGDITQMDTKS
jgi:hypothetical protein